MKLNGKGPVQPEQLSAMITRDQQTPVSKSLPSSLPTNHLIAHPSSETSPQDQVIPPSKPHLANDSLISPPVSFCP